MDACVPAKGTPSHDGFRQVVAHVRGITWAACAATMEVALRRRLEGVTDVSISQQQQTAAVSFATGTRLFSPAAFREAVAEADVVVVSLEADVCGVVDDRNLLRSPTGDRRPLVRLQGGGTDAGRAICVSGPLDDRVEPLELKVATLRPAS